MVNLPCILYCISYMYSLISPNDTMRLLLRGWRWGLDRKRSKAVHLGGFRIRDLAL